MSPVGTSEQRRVRYLGRINSGRATNHEKVPVMYDAVSPTKNPLYIPTRKIIVTFEFPGDEVTIKEVLAKFNEEVKDYLNGVHVRDRREDF